MSGDTVMFLSWIDGEWSKVRPFAARYLNDKISNNESEDIYELRLFFEGIISGKSYFGGTKGDMWLWGTVTKFPNIDVFLQHIQPFFKDLWEDNIILKFRPVYIFLEREYESTRIYKIFYNTKLNDIGIELMRSSEIRWDI